MAKKSKGDDRRARLEQLERERKAAERKRTLTFVGVIAVIAAVIIGATFWSLWSDRQRTEEFAGTALADIGVAESAADCDDISTEPAEGSGDHVAAGRIPYSEAPPSFGPHRPSWARLGAAKEFFTAAERPEVELLVHNLEHGYTILWYDETVADDSAQIDELEGLASKFSGNDQDPDNAFIAAPWTSDDGGEFPAGMHYALTHWSAGEEGEQSMGVKQYCGKLSGEVVASFIEEYPQSDAPEGGARFL